MGNAVMRNRIKRRLRAALANAKPPMRDNFDFVMISRVKAADCPYAELLRDIAFAFSRIHANKGVPNRIEKP